MLGEVIEYSFIKADLQLRYQVGFDNPMSTGFVGPIHWILRRIEHVRR